VAEKAEKKEALVRIFPVDLNDIIGKKTL
jgi:hypothetical protein